MELPAPRREAAVPSSSASSPRPVPVIPPPAEDPAASPAAEAMLRNKPTVDEPTSEPTRSCDESVGQSEPNSTATAAGCGGIAKDGPVRGNLDRGQKSFQEPFFHLHKVAGVQADEGVVVARVDRHPLAAAEDHERLVGRADVAVEELLDGGGANWSPAATEEDRHGDVPATCLPGPEGCATMSVGSVIWYRGSQGNSQR